ncbi:MAG: hypothetical protein KDA27_19740 [Candidatus Eisenbacteria bacterium]|uniref:Tetratricopeptide repeat protein n=1 Tax=Eiseniibacteriota bacterium TaxID=2212470 RepID=A0A956NEQ8_UNCEI|nr:hypothetical protein [Candidatus Eisenbacteria bacterium]MCB9465431.1 hypothetical protein [Candidatus Eisenbacteria bacterium]
MTGSQSDRGTHQPSGSPVSRQLSLRDRVVGALLLIGVVALLVYLRTPEEPSPLADLFLPSITALDESWLREAPSDSSWTVAIGAYESERYSRAAEQFDALAKGNDEPELAQLLLGSSYALAQRPNSATLAFRLAAGSSDARIAHEARWQLVLTLLREDEVDVARPELERVIRDEGPHAGEARAMVARIEASRGS